MTIGKKSISKLVGQNIKKQREIQKITLKELSTKTKITKQYLEKIELGTANKVKVSHVFIIAEVLKILPHTLFEN